jgi:hypothetical protein
VFYFRVDQAVRSQNLFPPETLPQIFANIKSIYQFHADFLLPKVSSFSLLFSNGRATPWGNK